MKKRPDADGVWKRQETPITKLNAIHAYNQTMSVVDRTNQLRNNYSIRLRSRKFAMAVFYFILDQAITNS